MVQLLVSMTNDIKIVIFCQFHFSFNSLFFVTKEKSLYITYKYETYYIVYICMNINLATFAYQHTTQTKGR